MKLTQKNAWIVGALIAMPIVSYLKNLQDKKTKAEDERLMQETEDLGAKLVAGITPEVNFEDLIKEGDA